MSLESREQKEESRKKRGETFGWFPAGDELSTAYGLLLIQC